MLRDGLELALLDVREQGVFARAHLLFACCVPLSRIELMIDDLVPRRDTRIVVLDGGDEQTAGFAARAAARLTELDYTDTAVLENGIEGWRAAGFELFSGVNVPSKAFGEIVEQVCHTPHITPEELKLRIDTGERLLILDARPMEEYRRMNIPGGINVPGAELVYRVHDLAPDEKTPIVVNCAGRTRSIIGAQSLRNAGITNPVMALKGGTMGWVLAGMELEHGQTRCAPPPSKDGLAKARMAARQVGERAGVTFVDRGKLAEWNQEAGRRNLFVLDVRSPEEYAAGHLPGSRSAPGGQLVQATDEYIGVRNARIALVDNNEIRATMTASWLMRMGWRDVYVLAGGLPNAPLEQGVRSARALGHRPVALIAARDLSAAMAVRLVSVLDVGSSAEYQLNHISGAWWGPRSRLTEALGAMSTISELVVTSGDGLLAQFAAHDAARMRSGLTVRALSGGTQAWIKAGLAIASGMERPTCTADDVWYKPYEQADAVRKAMQEYLKWEVELVPQIARDGDARFRPL